MPRNAPPGAYIDDPVANLEPATNERDSHFAMASHGLTRIKEWAARGDAKQRALRDDLVTLCICPEMFLYNKPSAAWVGRQHGVSREYASRLCREFVRKFGDYLQFRGQRFLSQALALKKRRGRGRQGQQGPPPGPVAGA
jgi:hypothetical protein